MEEGAKRIEIHSSGREHIDMDELEAAMITIGKNPARVFREASLAMIRGMSNLPKKKEYEVVVKDITDDELNESIEDFRVNHVVGLATFSTELNAACKKIASVHGEEYMIPAMLMSASFFEALASGLVIDMLKESTDEMKDRAVELDKKVKERIEIDKMLSDLQGGDDDDV